MKNRFKVKEERKRTKKRNRKEDLDTEKNLKQINKENFKKEEEQGKLRTIRNQSRKYEMKKRENTNMA